MHPSAYASTAAPMDSRLDLRRHCRSSASQHCNGNILPLLVDNASQLSQRSSYQGQEAFILFWLEMMIAL